MPHTATILVEGLRSGGQREINEISFNSPCSLFGKPATLLKPPKSEGKILSEADVILNTKTNGDQDGRGWEKNESKVLGGRASKS